MCDVGPFPVVEADQDAMCSRAGRDTHEPDLGELVTVRIDLGQIIDLNREMR